MRSLALALALVACGPSMPDAPDAPIDALTVDAPSDALSADAPDASVPASERGWGPLTLLTVVDPMDFGAVGDGTGDDRAAMEAAIASLPPAGGLVLIDGHSYRKTDLLRIARDHVKLWSPTGDGTIAADVLGVRRRQSVLFDHVTGSGVFGVRFTSDASERFDALEDNQISVDHGTLSEIVGVEIDGSAATGIFLYGPSDLLVTGNWIHDTWADHVHHTAGARGSWVWGNWIRNGAPSDGDDGVACVTYGPDSPRCGAMEWWDNVVLHGGWGRGFSVIGGDDVYVHDNWAIETAGAGLIVASEPSYDSASSARVRFERNVLYRCAHAIGHPGMLVSGQSTVAGPIVDVTLADNVVVETVTGSAYRAEGSYERVTETGTRTDAASLPPVPTEADVRRADTSVLRTFDTAYVPEAMRAGALRIHVRPRGDGYEQRIEYVVAGDGAALSAFAAAHDGVTVETPAGTVVIAWTPTPIALPAGLTGVARSALRDADRAPLWDALSLDP